MWSCRNGANRSSALSIFNFIASDFLSHFELCEFGYSWEGSQLIIGICIYNELQLVEIERDITKPEMHAITCINKLYAQSPSM